MLRFRALFIAWMACSKSPYILHPGNNNNINTSAKANFLPYGRDFPSWVPIVWFTNGKLTSDYHGMLRLSAVKILDFSVLDHKLYSCLKNKWSLYLVHELCEKTDVYLVHINCLKTPIFISCTLSVVKSSIFISCTWSSLQVQSLKTL